MTSFIPKWIFVVSSLICLLGLFVGGSLYFSPRTFIPDVDFSAEGVRFLSDMWAARQIAIAGTIGYCLVRKSRRMLKIALIAYCLMNLQDILIGITHRDIGIAIGASAFCLLSMVMISALTRSMKAR